VYGVLRDSSPEAVTPALGYAANVITVITIAFFALVMFIFWLGGLGEKGKAKAHGPAAAPVIAGGSDARLKLEGAETAPSKPPHSPGVAPPSPSFRAGGAGPRIG
jgi:hypothetical protein